VKVLLFVHALSAGVAHVKATTGGVVSNMIVSVISDVVLANESRNLMYTVLIPSHHNNVCHVVATHDCRFVGIAAFQNATWTHHAHASVGHTILRVTAVPLVANPPPFILNSHHAGDVLSLLMICVFEFVGHHP
jgi:hypothetical protein